MKLSVACPLCGARLKTLQIANSKVARWDGIFADVDRILFCPKCRFVFPVASEVPFVTEERYMMYDGIEMEPGEKGSIPVLSVVSPDTGERYLLKISGFWVKFWLKFVLWLKGKVFGKFLTRL